MIIHGHRQRNSSARNRKRETCTSGSVRGEGGNILTYSAARRSEWRVKANPPYAEGGAKPMDRNPNAWQCAPIIPRSSIVMLAARAGHKPDKTRGAPKCKVHK